VVPKLVGGLGGNDLSDRGEKPGLPALLAGKGETPNIGVVGPSLLLRGNWEKLEKRQRKNETAGGESTQKNRRRGGTKKGQQTGGEKSKFER